MCLRNGVLNPVRHADALDSSPGSTEGGFPMSIEVCGREMDPIEAQQRLSAMRMLSI